VIGVTSRAQPYILLSPALLLLALTGVLPLSFVFFYSVNDTFGGNQFLFVGLQWFRTVLQSDEFRWALLRSLAFSALALALQLPLGVLIALRMPDRGKLPAVLVVLMALPLLLPPIVVGYLWKAMSLPRFGLLTSLLASLGLSLDLNSKVWTWAVLLVMDAWHWTSLVVLLVYAGLKAVPADHYRAASIDCASPWAVFRHVQLPRLRMVLGVAAVLRFMDSFMIYAEAYVMTHGGPGVSTNFLATHLVQTATIEFDFGQGGAMAVIYFFLVLLVSLIFFRLVMDRRGSTA
jgi:glycerol transport system permease protein